MEANKVGVGVKAGSIFDGISFEEFMWATDNNTNDDEATVTYRILKLKQFKEEEKESDKLKESSLTPLQYQNAEEFGRRIGKGIRYLLIIGVHVFVISCFWKLFN